MRELGISLADIRLWRDGVVSRDELIVKRLHTMDDDSVKTQNCRRVCEALLRGEDEATALSHDFTFCEEETTEPAPDAPLLLGIDIGTTSLSAQIVELSSGRTVQTYSFDHNAAINIEGYADAYAQDTKQLSSRVTALVKSVTQTFTQIASIGIAGQMHGILCVDNDYEVLSPFYTWQNGFGQRITDRNATICEKAAKLCGKKIPTGYGILTYYALRTLNLLPRKLQKLLLSWTC